MVDITITITDDEMVACIALIRWVGHLHQERAAAAMQDYESEVARMMADPNIKAFRHR
jgi:hypothetical protein